MNIVFHYPPELLNLLIDTIPLLCRSKDDVLLFFKGAGVDSAVTRDLAARVKRDREAINKYEIARTVLTRLNERGEATLRERREILKRVTEFEDFSVCWPNDQLKAKGLVAEIRKVINVKDSFTRMKQEREEERKKHKAEQEARVRETQERKATLASVRNDLFSLFSEQDPRKRGKALEGVLNRLFKASGVLVREAFTLSGSQGEGVIEQIDGVIELEGDLYLVEMKWWDKPLGPGEIAQHLVRVFNRGHARGILISSSGYTEAAVTSCRESLRQAVFVLCKLEEIVLVLDREREIKELLKQKIHAAVIDKNPLYEPLQQEGR